MFNYSRSLATRFTVYAILFILTAGVLYLSVKPAIAEDLLPDQRKQTAPTPFFAPPYFGTSKANCVFDHQYPIYTDEYLYGDPISSTVVHYDGSNATSPIIIGTRSCYSGHNGIDYGLTYEPVLAVADGVVMDSRWVGPQNHNFSYGLFVRINHNQAGYSTIYGHLSSIGVDSNSDNPNVKKGDVIAISGSTGNSDGRHLHFESRYNSEAVNPYGWVGAVGQDPWGFSFPDVPRRRISHNLWQNPPSINNTNNLYPSGDEVESRLFPPSPTTPGVIIVDDSSAQVTGSCWQSRTNGGYNNSSYRYTSVYTDTNISPTCSVTWSSVNLLGTYEVFVHITRTVDSTTEGAIYDITYQGNALSRAIVFQAQDPDTPEISEPNWVYIGKYRFDGTGSIKLTNLTQDDAPSKRVSADTVMFAPIQEIIPTITPGPSPTAPTALPPTTLITLPMTETVSGSLVTLHDSSPPQQNASAYNTTAFPRSSDYARNLSQSGGVYSAIRFNQDNALYLADYYNRSLTIDISVRYSGSSGETATIANLASQNSVGVRGGWILQYSPLQKEFKLTVRSGSSGSTTPTTVRQSVTTLTSTDWVRIKAIKDGLTNKLILCVSINGSNWAVSEQAHNQGIYYIPNSKLDLGVASQNPDWTYNFAQNWQGDLDEFVYKSYADYSGGCQPVPTPTPTRTPTRTLTPTPTPVLPRLWTATPRYLATVPSNSSITLLTGNSFRARHSLTVSNYWMGGGVMATAREVPVGVIFRWASPGDFGKLMCNDPEFGPTINAIPCAWGATGGDLSSGLYCTAAYAYGFTPNEICQAVVSMNSWGSLSWPGGLAGGLGWEQRGNTGSREMLVQDIRWIYYSIPSPDYHTYLPYINKPVEPTTTPTASGPDLIAPPTEEPPPDGYPGLSTPTPMPIFTATITPTRTVTATRTATFTKTPKPTRTPRP
jgi:murein DD-endopeptidase MepM/ murein hydrolase activator NlpD